MGEIRKGVHRGSAAEVGCHFLLSTAGNKSYVFDKWQVKGSTATVASLGSTTAVPSPAHSTPCPQQLAGLAPQTPTQIADIAQEEAASACWGQPSADGSIPSSAAPKRATDPQTHPVPPPHTQPLAGAAFPQTQPPQTQTQPLVLQAPPQLPVGDGGGDDDDDDDVSDGVVIKRYVFVIF